jgi:hypothetical protein
VPKRRPDLHALDQEEEALLSKKREVEARLAEVRLERKRISTPAPSSASDGRVRPVRATVLDVLEDLEVAAHSNELRLFVDARDGRAIAPTRFGTLSKDETKAFTSKRPQAVYLCHGLTADRFEPIKRLWARSDWPLSERVVAPTTGRVLHLRMTVRLCELAIEVGEAAAKPEMLRIIAADHARDVPNVRVERGKFDLVGWRDAARTLLEQHLPRDTERREEAAARLAGRPLQQQLFGVEIFPLDGGAVVDEDAAGER